MGSNQGVGPQRTEEVISASDLGAVHPGDVGVVDRAEPELDTACRLVGRELEREPIPRDAVVASRLDRTFLR